MCKEDKSTYGIYAVVFVVLLTLALSGCGTFLTANPTAQDVSNSQRAVQNAAAIVAIEKPEWTPEMLKVSAAIVGGINAGSIITLADVQALVNQEATNMHFSPKTVAYANLFIINVKAEIERNGEVSLNVPVQLCMVAQWINNAIGGWARCGQKASPPL